MRHWVLWSTIPARTYPPFVIEDPADLEEATMAYTCILWQLSLDKELIEFGSYVVGETTSRIITLTNVGGLGTKFKFLLASEFFEMDESQSAVKIVSVLSASDQHPWLPWVSAVLLIQGQGGKPPQTCVQPPHMYPSTTLQHIKTGCVQPCMYKNG